MNTVNKIRSKKLLSLAVIAAILTSNVSVVSSADTSFDGDFDTGDFSVWDGQTYDFSWYDSDSTELNINSAAQFASLSILTNNLSGDDYADFVAALQNVPSEYISLAETFEGKTINLNVDIDLSNYNFLPISYAWNTPNVTHEKYNALAHVPDITPVDFYVGSDGNGKPISTRYYEYPEAEMRFRDLLHGLNFEGEVNAQTMVNTHAYKDCNNPSYLVDGIELDYFRGLGKWTKASFGNNPSNTDIVYDLTKSTRNTYGAINFLYIFHTDKWVDNTTDGALIEYVDVNEQDGIFPEQASMLRELTSCDILESYTYADVLESADTKGFSGTFNGDNNRIKGLHPSTPWTDDYTERLYTYDPIGKGLFGLIGEEGVVNELNIKGYYASNDVVSYSALLCAYNYGKINNCYVYCNMEQGLVKSIYPVRREYGEGGTSTYLLTTTEGAVLPVGNSGFVTAVNNGVIDNCITAGAVTQAYRQFGFMACTNNGTIKNCTNKASFSTQEVETDFMTDEWSYTYDMDSVGLTYANCASEYESVMQYIRNNSTYINSYYADKGDVKRQNYNSVLSWNDILWGMTTKEGYYDNYTAAFYQGADRAGKPWIPQLYKTDINESIAANHLYGVYGYTAVGGICAVNNGIVSNCVNEGVINVMYNTSTRNIGTKYTEVDYKDKTEEQLPIDIYNYIRPSNSYGLFSTQSETMNLAAGIAALNKGTVTNCINNAEVRERAISTRDRIAVQDSGFSIFAFTPNGFYSNDCIIYGAPEYKYNPLGFRWWWTEENQMTSYDGQKYISTDDEGIAADTNSYNFAPYDANMPYPMVRKSFIEDKNELSDYSSTIFKNTAMIQLASGICAQNMGIIKDTENDAKVTFGITHVSDGTYSDAQLNNIVQNGQCVQNLGYYIKNTGVDNVKVTNKDGDYGIAYIAEALGEHMIQNDISVYEGKSGYYKLYADDNRMDVKNIRLYDTELSGVGIAVYSRKVDFDNIANFQDSDNGLSEIELCNANDVFVYGDAVKNGIGYGTVDTKLVNCNFYGSSAEYAFGDFHYGTYTDCRVNMVNDDDSIGLANHILKAKEATVVNFISFADTDKRILDLEDCVVNDMIVYGNTPEFEFEFDYRYLFTNCDCTDMVLQTDINIEWKNPNFSTIQLIPGVLKTIGDTNNFTDCVVQTPNGAVSYPTFNYQLDEDVTILSDALLIYDENARVSGALAYAMDNGDKEDRRYEYTVSTNDTEDILAEADDFIDLTYVTETRIVNIPSHTRPIQNADVEKPFYRIAIPFTSNGAGEVIGSLVRGTEIYSTLAYNQIFPVTNLYLNEGETASLTVVEQEGYGLEKLMKAVNGEIEDLEWKKGDIVNITMGTDDITILSEWSDLYAIEVDDDPRVIITANAEASAAGHPVYVTTVVASPNQTVNRVWYCKYELNASNRLVLNTETQYDIDMAEMSFIMPKADVKIFASVMGSNALVNEFVLAGEQGIIDNDARTIMLKAPANVDLTAIAPDVFETENTAEISPDVTELRDFTQPVIYTLTADNGSTVDYVVTVIPTEDGTISYFDVLGKKGIINQEEGTISLEMSSDVDLTNVTPHIIWSGASISEEGPIDLSSGTYVYTVTSSTGSTKDYTVTVTIPENSTALQGFSIIVPGCEGLMWVIDDVAKTISATVPYGTDLSECTIETLDWYGMSTNMHAGDAINLTKCNYLVIKADNGDTITYAIIAKEAPADTKTINQLTIFGYDGVINEEEKTIVVMVPAKYDITNIAPDVLGFTAKAVEGAYNRQNFTEIITYTVTAYDGTTAVYTVTVTRTASVQEPAYSQV